MGGMGGAATGSKRRWAGSEEVAAALPEGGNSPSPQPPPQLQAPGSSPAPQPQPLGPPPLRPPLALHGGAPQHLQLKLLPALDGIVVQRQPLVHCASGPGGRQEVEGCSELEAHG